METPVTINGAIITSEILSEIYFLQQGDELETKLRDIDLIIYYLLDIMTQNEKHQYESDLLVRLYWMRETLLAFEKPKK